MHFFTVSIFKKKKTILTREMETPKNNKKKFFQQTVLTKAMKYKKV